MKLGLLAAGLTAVTLVLGACGLPEDDQPRVITDEEAPFALGGQAPEAEDAVAGEVQARIWFLGADGLLESSPYPVERTADDATSVSNAVAALLAGPNEQDAVRLSSAIPRDTVLLGVSVDGATATIDLGPAGPGVGVLGVAGTEQLKAFAQIVFTATEVDGIESVRFEVEGDPIEVPTDIEPAERPVVRDDYLSVRRTATD